MRRAHGHPVVPFSASAVAYRSAVRLADYLADLDLSFSALTPLVDQLPALAGTLALEQRRVRIVLDWGMRVVAPAASHHLTVSLAHLDTVALVHAGRSVRCELGKGAHIAGLGTAQALDLAVSYIWNAVFATFTLGHDRPLQPEAAPVLRSGHELLARLLAVSPDRPSDASDFAPWAPVPPLVGGSAVPTMPLSVLDFVAPGRPS